MNMIYSGLFFNESTTADLTVLTKEIFDVEMNIKNPRVTFKFRPNDAEIAETLQNLGNKTKVEVVGYGVYTVDEQIQNYGLRVIYNDNQEGHITVAVANGGKPVNTGKITEWIEISPVILTGVTGFFGSVGSEDTRVYTVLD